LKLQSVMSELKLRPTRQTERKDATKSGHDGVVPLQMLRRLHLKDQLAVLVVDGQAAKLRENILAQYAVQLDV
jgi:hypothetical protein